MNKTETNRLISYIEANRPIIYINTFDFNAFDNLIDNIVESFNGEIYEYTEGLGYTNHKTKTETSLNLNAKDFLKYMLDRTKKHKFILLKDFHEQLKNPDIISLLKLISLKSIYENNFSATIFIVSTKQVIPVELEKLITIYEVPLPNEKECIDIINTFAEEQGITIVDEVMLDLKTYLKGFSDFEIRQILNLAYQQSGNIKQTDIDFILAEKEQIIKKTGMLKITSFNEGIQDIGGLYNLKEWINKKASIFNSLGKAIKYGVSIPKGVLIVGMPGCGKSLTAKAIANLFKCPLLQLDVGQLLGKYIGESEENMRHALKIAEAISPTVLWIDEIEKAFAGVGSEHGHEVTTRLFGNFLTWLQEKKSSVFVVATSNDISKLPPEFLRKGRFDEIFFVDFPSDTERREIFKLHLMKRNKWHKDIDLIALIEPSKNYTGADIESVISSAIEKGFLNNSEKITTKNILTEIENTKPMAIALKDKIDNLKKSLEKLDIKNASSTLSDNKKA